MAHQVADNRVECEWCFELVPLRKLAVHRASSCSGRTVSCRFPLCSATFREWEREEHEKHYCSFKKARQKAMKAHRRKAQQVKVHRREKEEEELRVKQQEEREHRKRVEAFYAQAALSRERRQVEKEEQAKDRREKEKEVEEEKRKAEKRLRQKRDRILGAAKAKLAKAECGQCAELVRKKDMSKHLKFFCPYGTRTCETCHAKVRKMNWNLHSRGERPKCWECGGRPTEEPAVFQTRRKVQTVKGDLGPPPAKATSKLTQLAMQLQQRPKMRAKILTTFLDTEEELCALPPVDNVLQGSKGGFVVDWNEFLVKLLQLGKDMMVCEQAGRVGEVVVADVSICANCWEQERLAPLTGKEEYVRREVCPQVFLHQEMLERRQQSGAVLGWECQHGCGKTFASKTERKFHMLQECKRRPVKCICGGCPASFPLEERAAHEATCVFYKKIQEMSENGARNRRLVDCSLGCGEKIEIRRLDAHENKHCTRRYVQCQKGCGQLVQHYDLKRHIADDCQAKSEVERRKMIAKARRKYLETERSHSDPMVQFFSSKTLDPSGGATEDLDDGDDED